MSAVRGVNVAAITARREGPELDLAATFELLDYLSASGVNAIALLGSTGEFLHFEIAERIRLLTLAVKRSRVPIIAGVAHSSLDGAVALGRAAVDAGAATLLLMPPYFFRYSQEDVKEFFLRFAGAFRESVPILLYNIPFFTTEIACQTALDLLATGLFAGIKDSSGDWECFTRLKTARDQRGFTLLVGNDVIFTRARLAGADGVVSGCACAVPELMLGLDRAILSGAEQKRQQLEARLQEFISWLDRFPAPVGVREAVALRGLKVGPHSAPLGPRARQQLAEFRDWFKGWLPLVQENSANA
jgi:4-hydroxy-tetrahydrodipicolinate synthase